MNPKFLKAFSIIILLTVTLASVALAQTPMGTGFTYQGFLKDNSSPATGTYDFRFLLYDGPTDGTLVAEVAVLDDVYVDNGLFNVQLDFGDDAFSGNARWLGMSVRPGYMTGDGGYTRLGPRQPLTPAPYALYAGRAPQTDRVTAPADSALAALDTSVLVWHTSVTIGTDGLGLISYYDYSAGDLKVAHCDDVACSTATVYTLDSGGDVGEFCSVIIGADGLGLISYHDDTNDALKVAHCEDTACSLATTSTVDFSTYVTVNPGRHSSVTIGADGLGLISHHDADPDVRGLKVTHCLDTACSHGDTWTLDDIGGSGGYTSVTVGSDGLGLISYYDGDDDQLKVAHCEDIECSTANISMLEGGPSSDNGLYTSVTTGADGLGLISYFDFPSLKVAHCTNTACSSATSSSLDSIVSGVVGTHTSVTIGSDNLGLISYYDEENDDLKVAHCKDAACSSADVTTVDNGVSVGQYSSVTIGSDGLPLISYADSDSGGLKVAHCSNAFCIPYFRRR